ncbi:MAG TPA: Ku protein, partial [Microthrixaceae bacterium]|nr:Ku protein [Microthrixaceae bacterium]
EMKLARQIIDSLATDWKPERYHDTYTEELHDLLDKKAKGKEIVAEPAASEDEGAKVLDLMAALEASVSSAKRSKKTARKGTARKATARPGTRTAKKRAPARRKTARSA